MHQHFERYLRLLCVALGALFLYQVVQFATAPDPLATSGSPPVTADQEGPQENGSDGPPDLSPRIRAQVERITESGILGPVPQPPPMALLGIGGDHIFLRSPTGQTGIIRVGEELGGVKLLRIGINRVLIEHEGQTRELMMFSGFGGESLMPGSTSNETSP